MKIKLLIFIIIVTVLNFGTVFAEEISPGVQEVSPSYALEDGYVSMCFLYTNRSAINWGMINIAEVVDENYYTNHKVITLTGENCTTTVASVTNPTAIWKTGCGANTTLFVQLENGRSYEVYFSSCKVNIPLVY